MAEVVSGRVRGTPPRPHQLGGVPGSSAGGSSSGLSGSRRPSRPLLGIGLPLGSDSDVPPQQTLPPLSPTGQHTTNGGVLRAGSGNSRSGTAAGSASWAPRGVGSNASAAGSLLRGRLVAAGSGASGGGLIGGVQAVAERSLRTPPRAAPAGNGGSGGTGNSTSGGAMVSAGRLGERLAGGRNVGLGASQGARRGGPVAGPGSAAARAAETRAVTATTAADSVGEASDSDPFTSAGAGDASPASLAVGLRRHTIISGGGGGGGGGGSARRLPPHPKPPNAQQLNSIGSSASSNSYPEVLSVMDMAVTSNAHPPDAGFTAPPTNHSDPAAVPRRQPGFLPQPALTAAAALSASSSSTAGNARRPSSSSTSPPASPAHGSRSGGLGPDASFAPSTSGVAPRPTSPAGGHGYGCAPVHGSAPAQAPAPTNPSTTDTFTLGAFGTLSMFGPLAMPPPLPVATVSPPLPPSGSAAGAGGRGSTPPFAPAIASHHPASLMPGYQRQQHPTTAGAPSPSASGTAYMGIGSYSAGAEGAGAAAGGTAAAPGRGMRGYVGLASRSGLSGPMAGSGSGASAAPAATGVTRAAAVSLGAGLGPAARQGGPSGMARTNVHSSTTEAAIRGGATATSRRHSAEGTAAASVAAGRRNGGGGGGNDSVALPLSIGGVGGVSFGGGLGDLRRGSSRDHSPSSLVSVDSVGSVGGGGSSAAAAAVARRRSNGAAAAVLTAGGGVSLRRGAAAGTSSDAAAAAAAGSLHHASPSRAAAAGGGAGGGRVAARMLYDVHMHGSEGSDVDDVGAGGSNGGRHGGGGGTQIRPPPQRLFRVQLNHQASEGTTFGPARSLGPSRPPHLPLPPHPNPHPHSLQHQHQRGLRQRPSEDDDDGVVGGALAIGGSGAASSAFQERFLADLRRRDTERAAVVQLLMSGGEEELLRQAEEAQLAMAVMLSLQDANGGPGGGGGGGGVYPLALHAGALVGLGGGGGGGFPAHALPHHAVHHHHHAVQHSHISDEGAGGPSYEELLNLEDVKVTTPQDLLASLPISTYDGVTCAPDGACAICQCEYEPGHRLIRLPCCHVFHRACGLRWLGEYSKKCPVCKAEVA